MYLNYMIYVPDPDAAIGNLSLVYATHILMTRGEGGIHPTYINMEEIGHLFFIT
jgi:hypothetical protein